MTLNHSLVSDYNAPIFTLKSPDSLILSVCGADSPQRGAVLRVVEALDGSQEQRQRVRRVAADQRDDDPGSEERRLGAPALLGEIPPTRARQENEQQGGQQRGDPGHGRGQGLVGERGGGGQRDREKRLGGCNELRVPLLCYADSGQMAEGLTELKGRSGLVKGELGVPDRESQTGNNASITLFALLSEIRLHLITSGLALY